MLPELRNTRFFLAFLLVCNFLQASAFAQNNNLESFYLNTIKLDLKSAQSIAISFEDSELSKQAVALSQVLFKAGQTPHEPLPLLQVDNTIYSSEVLILNRLQLGYYSLYFNKDNIAISLKQLLEALELSIKIKNKTLQKISLLALLEFYHFEFQHTNQNYLIYLNSFKKLAENEFEKAWIAIHTYYFSQQNSFENSNSTQSLINDIVEYESKLNKNENLYWLLFSLKTFHNETELKFEEVIKAHKIIIENTKEVPFLKYLTFRSFYRISSLYIEKNDLTKAKQTLEESKQHIDRSYSIRGEVYIQYLSSQLFAKMGDYSNAFKALKTYDSLRNILNFKENSIVNSVLETQLRTEQKEKQLILEQQKNIQNRNLILLLATGLLALGIFSLLYYNNIKRKHKITKQEKVIAQQAQEKLLKEKEINTINAMIEGQEKERKRLAGELHDSVGGNLIAAKFQLDFLNTQTKNKQLNAQYFKLQELLANTYKEVRRLSHLKNSGVLPKDGLVPALSELAHNASTDDLNIKVTLFGLHNRINNKVEIALFRMIQELVTNIIKHAQATEAEISLTQRETLLSIFVEDNGIGFTRKRNISNNYGMGLTNIEKKVIHLNGQFEIDSTPGNGTHINIEIPLDNVE